jgi:hypothetical protein
VAAANGEPVQRGLRHDAAGATLCRRGAERPPPIPDLTPMARPSAKQPSPPRSQGLIEIVLPGGVSLRVDAHVDGRALRRVLGALEGR